MPLRIPGLLLLIGLLAACAGSESQPPAAAGAVDRHNSRNSLDWSGLYEGVVAGQDSPATRTRLTLGQDGSFEWSRRALVRGATPTTAKGRFDWQPDGNRIVLDAAGGAQRFAIGEGRVIVLESDDSRPDAAGATLVKLQPVPPGARTGLAEMLEDHRWTLTTATDADHQPLDVLFPAADSPFVFAFAGSRLTVDGGCNGLRGSYRLGADDVLSLGPLASTMRACEPPLMAAETALAGVLAAPLELVRIQGPEPKLAMLAESGGTLLLTGRLTPEARYGEATTIFLEVGPQRVPCDDSASGDGLCLLAREIAFDEQGLRVGTLGEFQPFAGTIDGFTHDAGTRSVLRVKRFPPRATEDAPADAVFVLDLIVESATGAD